MRDLTEAEVKAIAEATGTKVKKNDLALLTIRLNGMIDVIKFFDDLPINEVDIVPTLLTQRGGK